MALEDAATLAECVGRAETADDIPKVLKALQEIREPRCKLVQKWSAIKGKVATIPDGPEQAQRDKSLKSFNSWVKAKPWHGVHVHELPELERPNWKIWLNGYDAVTFVSHICWSISTLAPMVVLTECRQIKNLINDLDLITAEDP